MDNNQRLFNLDDMNKNLTKNARMQIMNNQVFTFVCGAFPLITFPVLLQRGQFIDITCQSGPITIRIGCGNRFDFRVATFNLRAGQAVQVSCIG
ncbi:hypothetical protein MHI39_15475 [Heyndrickxia sp. FSL K6-6286]|uniref:hypothetical protein n=1 Tax=Heyndrickxia sp. FSL K6-6286 TaxID=2921510 RepID=UPI00315B111E